MSDDPKSPTGNSADQAQLDRDNTDEDRKVGVGQPVEGRTAEQLEEDRDQEGDGADDGDDGDDA